MIIEYTKEEIIEQLQILKEYQDDVSDNKYNTQFYKNHLNKKKNSKCLQNQKDYYININDVKKTKPSLGNHSVFNNLDSLSSLFKDSDYLNNKDLELYDEIKTNDNTFQYFDLFYIFDYILTNLTFHISNFKNYISEDKFKYYLDT